MSSTSDELAALIREVPDFPKPGILFRDITTLLKDSAAFRAAVDLMAEAFSGVHVDCVVSMESRGFIFAAPLAYKLGAGMVPVRKPGKLPAPTVRADYALEYGTNSLEIHRDAIQPGQHVIVVDDLLATGGTVLAAIKLVEQLGGIVAGVGFLIELTALGGRSALRDYPNVVSIIQY